MKPFDAIEVSRVVEYTDPHGEQVIERVDTEAALQDLQDDYRVRIFYSIYVHRTGAGVECIADCEDPEYALLIGRALATQQNLPFHTYGLFQEHV